LLTVQLFSPALLLFFISHLVLQKYKKLPPNFFQNCGSNFYASFLMGPQAVLCVYSLPMAHFFEVTALPIGPGSSSSPMLIG
jgi:hypothetical protein